MSTKQVQIQNVLEIVAQSYLMDGQSPLIDDIYKYLSRFFADQPAGQPFKMSLESFVNSRTSSAEVLNDLMAILVANIDTLYETCFNHIDQMLMLNSVLRSHLERLRVKRNILTNKIDDYLLGIYSSDGFFFSYSDDFVSTSGIDFDLTTAFVDSAAGVVTIPALSTRSKIMNADAVSLTSVSASDQAGNILIVSEKTQFDDALDGLSNTSWFIEIKTNNAAPIVLDIVLMLSNQISDNLISKIDLHPFGIEAVQCGINATYYGNDNLIPFSSKVRTSSDKMSFIADQVRSSLRSINLQLKKDKPDYYINDSSERTGVYIFGFKEIMITEQYFDQDARFVSVPIRIPPELGNEGLIDSISLVTDESIPPGTSIKYYVAEDIPAATNISGYNWRQITPLTDTANLLSQIVNFGGSRIITQVLRISPRNENEIKMFPPNTTNVDPSKRNPTPSYFNQVDAYRVARIEENVLINTIKLEEGINSTRIFYTSYDPDALNFAFWRGIFDAEDFTTTYGSTDTGHGFLYGADVGENEKSVYSETFVYVDEETPVILKRCSKMDLNSRTWDIKVFLNGREIASLPVGVDRLTVPWKFKQGKNHVVVMANIPGNTSSFTAPYLGSFDIMDDAELYDYGIAKLDDWNYVDPFKFEFNITNKSNSFTIYNNEIVTRKQPTDNFRLTFNQPQATYPEAIRLRADLARTESFALLTPVIDSYRLRFSYASPNEIKT